MKWPATIISSAYSISTVWPARAAEGLKVHRRDRAPILIYRCAGCRRIFNAFTATPLQGTQRRPVELVLILRGIAQGVSTS
jgi:transposase-like protein